MAVCFFVGLVFLKWKQQAVQFPREWHSDVRVRHPECSPAPLTGAAWRASSPWARAHPPPRTAEHGQAGSKPRPSSKGFKKPACDLSHQAKQMLSFYYISKFLKKTNWIFLISSSSALVMQGTRSQEPWKFAGIPALRHEWSLRQPWSRQTNHYKQVQARVRQFTLTRGRESTLLNNLCSLVLGGSSTAPVSKQKWIPLMLLKLYSHEKRNESLKASNWNFFSSDFGKKPPNTEILTVRFPNRWSVFISIWKKTKNFNIA